MICPYCNAAKQLLKSKGLDFEEIRVDLDYQLRKKMMEKSGRTSVPQIFIGEHHIGGFDDLYALENKGQLDGLISQQ